MSYPGEYPQPLKRTSQFHAPAISGYVTARLRAADPVRPRTSGEDTQMSVIFENVGNTFVSVKLQQTSDRTVSGTRIDVISGVALVAGGRRTISTNNCFMEFLELATTFGGPSNVRVQIESQRRWEEMAFDRTDSVYPSSLWQAKPTPVATPFS